MANSELGIQVDAMVESAISSLKDLLDAITGLPQDTESSVNVKVLGSEEVSDTKSLLESFENSSYDASVNVNDNATSIVSDIQSDLNQIDSSTVTASLYAEDYITPAAENASSSLANVGDSATITESVVNEAMSSSAISVDGLTSSLNDASTTTSEIGDKSIETGEKADEGFGMAEVAVFGFLAGLELANREVSDLNARFDKMSGLSLPESDMRSAVADITDVTMNADEALDYIRLLKQAGVKDLGSLKRGASAFNVIQTGTQASQQDVEKLARSFRVLGVDMSNIESTYGAVGYAQSNVMGGLPEYIRFMQRFDSKFADMGLNIDQSAVLITAAQKKFGGGRAALSGLSKALSESGGDVRKLEQDLGMMPGTLDNASQETAKYSQNVIRSTEASRNNATSMQQTQAAIEDTNILWGDSIKMVTDFGVVVGGLGTLFTIAIPGALKVLDKIWGTGMYQWYKTGLTNLVGYGKNFGLKVIEGIGKILPEGLVNFFKELPGKVGPKVSGFFDDILKYLRPPGGFGGMLGKIFGQGMLFTEEDIIGRPGSEKRKARDTILSDLGVDPNAKSDLENFINWVNSQHIDWGGVFDNITLQSESQWVLDQLNGFYQWIQGLWPQITGMSPIDWLNLLGPLNATEGVSWILGEVAKIPDWFINILPSSFGDIYNSAASIVGNMINGFIDSIPGLQEALDQVRGVVNWLFDTLSHPEKWYELGSNLLKNMVDGLWSQMPSLDEVTQYISDHFPKSPPKIGPLSEITSKGMMSYGSDLASGLSSGLGNFEMPNNVASQLDSVRSAAGSGSTKGIPYSNAGQIDPYVPTGQRMSDWYRESSSRVREGVGAGSGTPNLQDDARTVRESIKEGSYAGVKDGIKDESGLGGAISSLRKLSGDMANYIHYQSLPEFKNLAINSPSQQARMRQMIGGMTPSQFRSYITPQFTQSWSNQLKTAARTGFSNLSSGNYATRLMASSIAQRQVSSPVVRPSNYGFSNVTGMSVNWGLRARDSNDRPFTASELRKALSGPKFYPEDNTVYRPGDWIPGGMSWNTRGGSGGGVSTASRVKGTDLSRIKTMNVERQVVEGVNVSVKLSDIEIRNDMDIKKVSMELGTQIGRQALQSGILAGTQLR